MLEFEEKKEQGMGRKRFTSEQIITMLREAEVLLNQCQLLMTFNPDKGNGRQRLPKLKLCLKSVRNIEIPIRAAMNRPGLPAPF